MDRASREALSASMRRLADGDRSAFPSVFAAVRPAIVTFAQRMLGDESTAEDVAQQALLDVFERAAEYDASRDALTWVIGIAAWKCRTFRKKRSRRREAPIDAAGDLRGEDAVMDALAERRQTMNAVQAVLGHLSPADIEVILADAGWCDRPDIKPATYRKRLERALARFRRAWGENHGAD